MNNPAVGKATFIAPCTFLYSGMSPSSLHDPCGDTLSQHLDSTVSSAPKTVN